MNKEAALDELKGRVANPNLIKHSLAVEAIMKALAEHMEEDTYLWSMAGLLHDIDYDKTAANPALHGILGAEILYRLGFDNAVIYAVKAHNDIHGLERKRKIDKALYAADPTSGLITAAALILPSKKLADVTMESLMKRFGEKSFARGANRNQIMECEQLGYTLEGFLGIALNAMKKIADELEL